MDEVNIKPLLERVFIFLEDGEWEKADEYCERVLDVQPTNATAYLGKLLAEVKVPVVEKLIDCRGSFENSKNFQKVVRYGDEELTAKLNGYIKYIKTRNETQRIELIYSDALNSVNSTSVNELFAAAEKFKSISDYKDSKDLEEKCYAKAQQIQYETAERERQIAEEKEAAKKKRKRKFKRILRITIPSFILCIALITTCVLIHRRNNTVKDIKVDINCIYILKVGGRVDVIEYRELPDGADPDVIPNIEEVGKWRNIKKITVVSLGDGICLFGLKSNGTVVVSGKTGELGLENAKNWTDIKDIACTEESIYGLKEDGTVVSINSEVDVSGWKDVKSIECKEYTNTIALKNDGTVVADEIDLTDHIVGATDKWRDIVSVSAGGDHYVGLKSDGTVVAAGYNEDGRCDVGSWTNVVKVVCSTGQSGFRNGYTYGLREDGTVYATGSISRNYLENIEEWENIIDIVDGRDFVVGLRENGTVVVDREGKSFFLAGEEGFLDYREWTDIEQIFAYGGSIIAVKSDGTLVSNEEFVNDALKDYKVY